MILIGINSFLMDHMCLSILSKKDYMYAKSKSKD